MFRKPRDTAEATTVTSPPKPSTGRPPTPPLSMTPKIKYTTESVPAPITKAPAPLLGRSKSTARTNGRSSLSAGGKMGGKSNHSILNFFKKADPNRTIPQSKQEEESLFLDCTDLDVDGESPTQIPTPPRDDDMPKEPYPDESTFTIPEEPLRYKEIGGSVKRRRLSADPGKITTSDFPRPNPAARKGPFVDALDDEDQSPDPLKVEIGESSNMPLPGIASRIGNCTLPALEEPEPSADGTTETGSTTATTVPILKREPTSHTDEPDYDGLEDFIEDEYLGEEYMERRWMEEQAEFEAGLDDEDGSRNTPDQSCNQIEQPETTTLSEAASSGSCPICGGGFGNVSEQVASKHVNDCLDGKAQPLFASKPPTTEPAPAVKSEIPSLKRFQRAAIARPAQENPFNFAATGPGGSSAFSKLMSGHAEDAAWATAAATEVASRGKPAYQRTCPFYKILPGLFICVDAFRYGAVEGCKAYFLSHFHSDHYIGLTSSWCHGPIYCSRVTANLVRRQLRVDPKWVVDLEFGQKVEVPRTQGVHVTMIPANHCPGSSLYLYEKVIGKGKNPKVQRILHCGDFRACPAHVQHPLLRPDVIDTVTGKSTGQQKLDVCYLDTTYLTPKYAFPSQEEVIKACADMCVSLSKDRIDENDDWEQTKKERAGSGMVKFIRKDSGIGKEEPDEDSDSKASLSKSDGKKRGRLLVIVGTYSIGKERICLGVAKALNSKIYATPNKQKICAALEDPELMARLTDDPLEAQVHMQMLMEIRAETLADYLTGYKPHFSRIVGFRPSGWNYRPPSSRFTESPAVQTVLHSDNWKSKYSMAELVPQRGSTRESQCFGVPYSEHSSFRELTMFCCALRIDKIVPTVNVGSARSRERMKGWCEKWAMEKKKNGLFRVADGQTAWS
ncbi:MAG: hypothetical protein LQ343_001816 [Gyalolechia ehrenbergii]|nr:MAG: hypothetical protein LQ343_001816 [Gyalolechia ehrenbergii]